MWVSTKEAAKILGVSERTVQRWVKDGKMKSKEVRGKGRGGKVLVVWINDTLTTSTNDKDVVYKSNLINDLEKINDTTNDIGDSGENLGSGITKGILEMCPQSKNGLRTIGDTADTEGDKGNSLKDKDLNEISENLPADRSIYWLEVDEVAHLMGVSERTVRRRCMRGDVRSKKVNGKYLIPLDSLPPEAQYKYLEEKLRLGVEGELLRRERGIGFSEYEARTKRGQQRLRALIMFLSKPEGVSKEKWAEVVGRMVGRSKQTIWRWYGEYMRGRKRESKAGILKLPSGKVIRSRSFSDEVMEFALRRLYERARQSGRGLYHGIRGHVWEDVREVFGLSEDKKVSFYRFLSEVLSDAGVVAYIEGGERKVEKKIAPYIIRDREVYEPLEVIVGDQKVWDWVVEYEGRLVRPVSYFFLDMKTMAVVGHVMSISKYSRWEVGLALKRAVSYGLPDVVYFDNGKAELSKYIEQIQNRIGFIKWIALPYNAKAKLNETFHRKIDLILTKWEIPGYFRREGDREKDIIKRENLRAGVLSFEEFYRTVERAIDEHNRGKMEEILRSNRPVYLKEDLEWMFLYGVIRKVRNSTVQITLDGFGKMLFYSPKLAPYNAKRVEVRINPYEVSESRTAYVLTLEGELIDRAELWEAIDPRDRFALAEKMRQKREIVKLYQEFFGKYGKRAKVIKLDGEVNIRRGGKKKGMDKQRAYLKLAEKYGF